jgi:multidrug efflux pump subunit AcrB
VAGLGNIDDIISTVRDGSSTTIINFTLGTDIDRATNDVRDALRGFGRICPPAFRSPEFSGWSLKAVPSLPMR